MKKNVFLLTLSLLILLLTAACGQREQQPNQDSMANDGPVALTVWGAEEDEALLQEIFASFQAHYAGQASFQITYQPQSESNCKDVLLGDLEGGADVFAFADDQVAALAAWTRLKMRRIFRTPLFPPPWKRPAWGTLSTPIR